VDLPTLSSFPSQSFKDSGLYRDFVPTHSCGAVMDFHHLPFSGYSIYMKLSLELYEGGTIVNTFFVVIPGVILLDFILDNLVILSELVDFLY
jgi:hypothetical protein